MICFWILSFWEKSLEVGVGLWYRMMSAHKRWVFQRRCRSSSSASRDRDAWFKTTPFVFRKMIAWRLLLRTQKMLFYCLTFNYLCSTLDYFKTQFVIRFYLLLKVFEILEKVSIFLYQSERSELCSSYILAQKIQKSRDKWNWKIIQDWTKVIQGRSNSSRSVCHEYSVLFLPKTFACCYCEQYC